MPIINLLPVQMWHMKIFTTVVSPYLKLATYVFVFVVVVIVVVVVVVFLHN